MGRWSTKFVLIGMFLLGKCAMVTLSENDKIIFPNMFKKKSKDVY